VAAVQNQQEQNLKRMDRYAYRIVARQFKTQKGQPAKATGFTRALVGRNFTNDQPYHIVTSFGELGEARVRSNDLKTLLTIEVEFRRHVNYLKCERRPYAGLVNEGTTCYLNSVMQALFMMQPFRRAAYELQVDPSETKDVKLCIQRLFYSLQVKHENVKTTELCTAFGWTAEDRFEQHDTDEF